MANYRYVLNPHTGKYQKVLKDDYIKAIDDIADAIAKKHTQNTDEYLITQVTTTLYVDGNRTDSYTANGTITRPFKTIQSAIDSISDAGESKRYSVNIAGGKTYEEQVTLKSHVYLKSDKIAIIKNTGASTIIAGGSGSQSMRIEKIMVQCYSDDETHSALSISGTGNVSIYDCLLYGTAINGGSPTGAEGLRMTSGTVSGHDSSFQGWNWALNMSGGFISIDRGIFTGWGNDVQRTGGTLQLGLPKFTFGGVVGTYTLKYAGSVIDNDSSVTGDTIKDALETLGADSHSQQHSIVNSADHSDKSDYVDAPLSPMILTGGLVSEGTNAGTIKVEALTALLRTTDSIAGALVKVTLAEQDNQVLPSADTIYKVILDYNSGSPQILIQTGNSDGTTQIELAICMKDGSNNIHRCNCGRRLQDGIAKLHVRAHSLRDIELASGCVIGEIGTRNITITSGIVYEGINRFTSFSEEIFDTSKSAPDNFTYFYRDGGIGWTKVIDQTQIDNVYYDNDSGTLQALTAQQYGIHWVYLHPDDEHIYIVYGQDSYKLAEVGVASPPSTLPIELSEFAVLIGRIIIQKNSATFELIQSAIDTVFNPAGVEDHNESANLQGGTVGEYYHLTSDEHTNKYIQGNEIKIKIYEQDTEPDLEHQNLAMWIDTNDSDKVYIVFRRGSGDQVKIELT